MVTGEANWSAVVDVVLANFSEERFNVRSSPVQYGTQTQPASIDLRKISVTGRAIFSRCQIAENRKYRICTNEPPHNPATVNIACTLLLHSQPESVYFCFRTRCINRGARRLWRRAACLGSNIFSSKREAFHVRTVNFIDRAIYMYIRLKQSLIWQWQKSHDDACINCTR